MNRVYFKIIKTSNVAKSSQISIHTDGVSKTLKLQCLPVYILYIILLLYLNKYFKQFLAQI